jgi:hypothetical protein
MTEVAEEVNATLPNLSPNERRVAAMRIAALSSGAGDLLAGDLRARDLLAGDLLAGDLRAGDLLAGHAAHHPPRLATAAPPAPPVSRSPSM